MSSAAKGKAKATEPSKAEPEVRRRAVADGQVIVNWADLGVNDNAQRGYDQAKFEEAYRYVVFELGPKATAKKQREREQKALDASKLAGHEAAIARILRELDVTKAQAESALIGADMNVDNALRSLVQLPPSGLTSNGGLRGGSSAL